MKRGFLIATSLCLFLVGSYFALGKLAIRHETLNLFDAARNRPVVVDIAVRRDAECKAGAGITTLPIAIISHGNTVKNTEYSFLANVLATRGYLVASIQHDLPDDAPLMTEDGSRCLSAGSAYMNAANRTYCLQSVSSKKSSQMPITTV